MRTVSDTVKNALNSGTACYLELRIDYFDGSYEYLSKSNFSISSNGFTDGTGLSSFPLGNAHAKQVNVSLINDDDRYKDVDFTNAIFTVNACVDVNGTKYEIPLGQHTVIDPESYGDIVAITAMDEMYKGDVAYNPGVEFPTTIGMMFVDSCEQCGIIATSDSFPNSDFVVNEAPVGITHRTLWGWCGLIAGGNARINSDNRMEIISYDWDYTSTVTLQNPLSNKLAADNVVITGIKTTVGEESYSFGTVGYVVEIDCPLASSGPQDFVDRIGSLLVGASFRPFEGTYAANPLVEFGDPCKVIDRKGNSYYSMITDVNYSFYGKTTVKCSADNAIRNSSTYNSAAASAYMKSQVIVNQEAEKRKEDIANIQLTADGKNRVWYQDEAPTGNHAVGDMWYDTDNDNKMHFWDGESWVAQEYGTGAIAAESITTDKIAAGAITTAKLAAQAVTAEKINVLDLFAQEITATGTITGATLRSAKIYSTEGEIGGFTIEPGAIYSASQYNDSNGNVQYTQLHLYSGGGSQVPSIYFIGGHSASASNWSEAAIEVTHDDSDIEDSFSHLVISTYSPVLEAGRAIKIGFNDITLQGPIIIEDPYVSEVETPYLVVKGGVDIIDGTNGTAKLNVEGDIYSSGVYSSTTTSAANMHIGTNYKMVRYASSSRRYKTDIQDLTDADLDPHRLYDLPVVEFRYNEGYLPESDPRNNKLVPGFIAEDVYDIYPIAADLKEDTGEPEDWGAKWLIPGMLKLIQELNDRIQTLEHGEE